MLFQPHNRVRLLVKSINLVVAVAVGLSVFAGILPSPQIYNGQVSVTNEIAVAQAASTGAVYPTLGTTASEAPWSDNNWTTPTNIYSDDGATANVTATTFDSPDQTRVLKATGFDFSSIPDGSTINGITVSVNTWYRSGQGSGSLDLCQLLDESRAKVGTNNCATPTALTTDDTTVITKGGTSDTWGNSLTTSWLKDPDFGVALGILATAANADVDIDYVTIDVDYTLPVSAPVVWNATDWTSYDTITIESDNVADDLTDFPVYVDLSDLSATFWSTTPAASNTVGTDIRVTTNDGSPTELPRELVFASSTAQTGELHFKANSISSTTDTTFRIYYNGTTTGDYATTSTYGAQNVWSNGFEAVYHLNEDPGTAGAGGILDSTGWGNDGTDQGTMTTADKVAGKTGYAFDFDGSDDTIQLTDIDFASAPMTLSAWFKVPDSASSTDNYFLGKFSDFNNWIYTSVGSDSSNGGTIAGLYDGAKYVDSSNNTRNWADDNWHHYSGVFDASNATNYTDGVATTSDSHDNGWPVNDNPWYIGSNNNASGYLTGLLDEVRIASSTRTAAWIDAEYTNQSTTTDFYRVNSLVANWNATDWTSYDTITIESDNVADDLTDFPVYVDLADLSATFWSTTPSASNTVGTDIRVTTNDGSPTELPRELVFASSTLQTGELHFKADSISSTTDTTFRIYYNGSTDGDYATDATYGAQNVWRGNGFEAVYHLNEDPGTAGAGGILDSTGWGNDGTDTGSMTSGDKVAGKTGYAFDFDGGDDNIDLTDMDFATSPFTLSAWFKSNTTANQRILSKFVDSGNQQWIMLINDDSAEFGIDDATIVGYATEDLTNDAWRHIVGSVDASNAVFYIDGVATTSAGHDNSFPNNDNLWTIGSLNDTSEYFTGLIDEVRIASTTRTAAWIDAEYLNQSTTTDFYRTNDAAGSVAVWNDTDWTLYDTIAIESDNVDDDLTDFPVYVDLSDLSATFWSTTPAASNTVGTDIRITVGTTTGSTELPRELVYASSTLQTGELHFKADSISSTTDTVFYLWYNGNTDGDYAVDATYGAQNVWSNAYDAVYHLHTDPSELGNTIIDSSPYANHGSSTGDMTTGDLIGGQIGTAFDFDGSDDNINLVDFNYSSAPFTISVWSATLASTTQMRMLSRVQSATNQWGLISNGADGSVTFGLHDGSNWNSSPNRTQNWADGNWRYLVGVADASDITSYTNGMATTSDNHDNNFADSPNVWNIGSYNDTSEYFTGLIDEVRIASTTRTAAWIDAEYTNQSTTTDFYTINATPGGGPAVPLGPGIAITGTLYENDGVTPITRTATITAAVGTSTVSLHSTTTAADGSYVLYGIASSTITSGVWSTSTDPTGVQVSGIVYGNGRFVMHGSNFGEPLAYSDDGINWTNSFSGAGRVTGVAYGNGLFVAVMSGYPSGGPERVAVSEDGINWTLVSVAGDNDSWEGVAYGDGRFVAISSSGDKAMYTDDGYNWATTTVTGDPTLYDITYGNGRFVATNGTAPYYSTDGVSWSSGGYGDDTNWFNIGYGGGVFIAFSGGFSGNEIATSIDGASWTLASAPLIADGGDVVYANGMFVVVTTCDDVRECIMYSSDAGATWATSTLEAIAPYSAIGYGNGRFVVANSDSGSDLLLFTDAGFGQDTPITLFVDENATTSSSTANTLTYGVDNTSGTTTVYADLVADTVRLQKTNGGQTIRFDDTAFYDSYDAELVDPDDHDLLFTATTSTTTVNADLYIDSNTTVYAPKNLVIDGDFANYGTFYAERGEVVADATAGDVASQRLVYTSPDFGGTSRDFNVTKNGTKMYLVFTGAGQPNNIEEYDLTVPYDISTYSYVGATTSVGSVTGVASGMELSRDGTKMYIAAQNDTVYEFDLSPAWDISSAVYNGNSSSTAQDFAGRGASFSPDGTRFYTIDANANPDSVLQYSLSTPWDVTTLSYVGIAQLPSGCNTCYDIEISDDGSYIVAVGALSGQRTKAILATPWDISTMSFGDSFESPADLDSGVDIHPNGSELYLFGGGVIEEHHLDTTQHLTGNFSATSSLFDLTIGDTATVSPAATTEVDNDYHVGGSAAGPYAGLVELTGTSTLSGTGNFGFVEVQGTASSTASSMTFTDLTVVSGADFTAPAGNMVVTGDFDVSAGTFDANSGTTTMKGEGTYGVNFSFVTATSVAAQDSNLNGLEFSTDGSKMYMLGYNSNNADINEYTLSIPWDVSTASYVQTTSIAAQEGYAVGLYITPDGRNLYTTGRDTDTALQYRFDTPWDISTLSYVASTSTLAQAISGVGITLKEDGTRMYITEEARWIYEYELTTPYDVTSASYIGANRFTLGANIKGIRFSGDGTRVFTTLSGGGIRVHDLPAPWDLSSDTIVATFAEGTGSGGIDIKPDGSVIYIIGDGVAGNDTVSQYDVTATLATTTGANAFYDLTFNNGPVTFTGDASTTNTFTLSNAGATTTFNASSTYTFQNINWQGSSSTEELILRSSANGTQWLLDVPGSQINVEFVNVQDSNATSTTGDIIASTSTDSGNNTNWTFAGAVAADEWNSTDWTLYDTITIKHQNIDEGLTDFPVYVDLSDLSTQFWSTVSSGGGDIRVTTDDTNPIELAREVVSASTTAETGELHFKADYVSDVIDTSFRIYYNGTTTGDYATTSTYGAQNVWSNGFEAVYHLNEDPGTAGAGGILDSTGWGNDGTDQGTMTTADKVAGKTGYAIDFDGGDDTIQLTDMDWSSAPLTLSAWFKIPESASNTANNVVTKQSDFENWIYFNVGEDVNPGDTVAGLYDGTKYVETTNGTQNWTNDVWHHYSVVFDASTATNYTDGVATTSDTHDNAWPTNNNPWYIGSLNGSAGYLTGQLDEIRLASSTRSAAWIKAEYYNQSTTTDFYFLEAGTGSTTLSDHDAGQVANAFNFQNKTNEELFAFKLTPQTGNATVTELTLALTGARKIDTGDFSNIRLLRDDDSDGVYDAGDAELATGVMTLGNEGIRGNNQQGTIVFSDDFLSTTTSNYLVVADWNYPDNGSALVIDVTSTGFIATDSSGGHAILGDVEHVQHQRNNAGGGGGATAAVGGAAPAGDGDVGGGAEGGGGGGAAIDTNTGGDTIGSAPDFEWPSANSGSWTTPEYAYDGVDGTYATTSSNNTNNFNTFAHGVPGTDTIEGVAVKLEISGTSEAGSIDVELSWNNGTNWTSAKTTPTLTTTDTVVTLGGPSDTWGRGAGVWQPSHFSDANFVVRLTGNPSSNEVRVDGIQVKVYHQAGGGGAGGGGGGGI